MKKSVRLLLPLFFAVVFAVFLTSFVSAASPLTDLISGFFKGFFDVARPFLEILTGTLAPTSTADVATIFYAKLLAMILIFSIVYAALSASNFFNETRWVLWTVSIIVAVLGIRFLTPEWINTIIIPHSVFGVAVSAGLPFVLFFFVINKVKSSTVRRVSWIFFGVVFLALWSQYSPDNTSLGQIGYVYPLTALLALIMVLFDGSIARWRAQMIRENLGASKNVLARANLQSKIDEVRARMLPYDAATNPKGGTLSRSEGKDLMKEYESHMKTLLRGGP